MVNRLIISIVFLLLDLTAFGQTSNITFHRHEQICHFIGTTDEDFIISLNGSLITIARYSIDNSYNYPSITKTSYQGTFVQKGDTIVVNYLTKNSEYKSKKKQAISKNGDSTYLFYPSNIFIISDKTIRTVDRFIPTLKLSSVYMVNKLEAKFQTWTWKNKSRFDKILYTN
jgi:hypothetical protein